MDILARIQKATRSTKNTKTIDNEGSPDRSFPNINPEARIKEDKERRFLYNLAKKTGASHRNQFNKTARVFGLKGDANWMCPGSLDGEDAPRENLNLNYRTRFLM